MKNNLGCILLKQATKKGKRLFLSQINSYQTSKVIFEVIKYQTKPSNSITTKDRVKTEETLLDLPLQKGNYPQKNIKKEAENLRENNIHLINRKGR